MKQVTKVCFRKFPEGDVIALFPDEIWNLQGDIMTYMHIWQHSGAPIELVIELEKAKPREYKALLNELKAIGYNDLKVIK